MKWIARVLWLCSLCGVAAAERLRNLFLVGDSISFYYTPDLQADLAGEASLTRKIIDTTEPIATQLGDPNVQGGDSRMVLQYLRGRFQEGGFRPEVVLVNCGLHDIKRDPKTKVIAVEAPEYAANLKAIEALVRSHGAKLVWINTTPSTTPGIMRFPNSSFAITPTWCAITKSQLGFTPRLTYL